MKTSELQKENFQNLINSYVADMMGDAADVMAEKALRGLARQWGGCISCAFSRKYKARRPQEERNESWIHRTCVLGLQNQTCGEHLTFPEGEMKNQPM